MRFTRVGAQEASSRWLSESAASGGAGTYYIIELTHLRDRDGARGKPQERYQISLLSVEEATAPTLLWHDQAADARTLVGNAKARAWLHARSRRDEAEPLGSKAAA